MFNFGNHNKLYLGRAVNNSLNSFYFDGVNDTFQTANNTILDYTTTYDFCVALSFRAATLKAETVYTALINKRINTGTFAGWSLQIKGSKLNVSRVTTGGNYTELLSAVGTITTGSLYRIFARFSDVQANCGIWLNGSNIALTPTIVGTVGNITNTGKVSVGSFNDGGEYFNGKIAEICFWNSNQSNQAISDYNGGFPFDRLLLPTPPEHYWKAELNGNDSGTIGGYTLTASGGATYGESIV